MDVEQRRRRHVLRGVRVTFEQTMRLLQDFVQTFSTKAPPVIVHSRREVVRVKLAHRVRRRSLARIYRQITGESLHAAQRRKLRMQIERDTKGAAS